jgi:aminopeptidase N
MKYLVSVLFINLIFSYFLFGQSHDLNLISATEKGRFFKNQKQSASVLPNNYDLTYCRTFWEVDPAIKLISGQVYYEFFHADSINEFKLELNDSLITDSVLMNGILLNFSHTNNVLSINFNSFLPANQHDSLSVYYHGIPPESGFGSFAAETHGINNVPVLWTLSEPYGAKDWWPIKQDLNDKIDSIDIFVKAPSIYKVASNGILISEVISGSNKVTYWKHRYPIAAYLVAIAVSDYTVFTNQVQLSNGNLEVLNYVYNEDLSAAQFAVGEMINHLKYFDSLFVPYPFMNEKYGHAQFNWGGGMEHQTMSFVGGFSYELLAHELAHQWFGDHVTCGSWQDLWLNEGFATYATGLCYERFSPNLYWKIWKANQINFITSSPDGSVFVTDTMDISRLFDARLTYSKAAMVLHMLRWKVGDDHFFNALRNYQNNPLLSYSYARNVDLKNELEIESGQNLDEFYNDWFWGEGYPSYTLNYDQDSNNLLTFSLSQSQSHPSVSFFEMPVPILFKNATQDTLIVYSHDFSGQTFVTQLSFKVDSVIFNPENWLVCNQNLVLPTKEYNALTNGIKVFPNPANETLIINLGDTEINNIKKIEIISVDGKRTSIGNFKNNIQNSAYQLDLNGISKGLYSLYIETSENIYNAKFVKQ